MKKKDANRLNKLIRKAQSVVSRLKLSALEEVVEDRIHPKFHKIMDNSTQPLHKTQDSRAHSATDTREQQKVISTCCNTSVQCLNLTKSICTLTPSHALSNQFMCIFIEMFIVVCVFIVIYIKHEQEGWGTSSQVLYVFVCFYVL